MVLGNMYLFQEKGKCSERNIFDFCHEYKKPVIITRNRESDLAVMTIEIYEGITGVRNLINLL